MSKQNKYRGKRIDNGEWVYGYLIGDDVIVGEIVEWDDDYFCTLFWLKVDPETVGQYIGKKDQFGTEIYEGDIDGSDDENPMYVTFEDAQYGLKFIDDINYFNNCIQWEYTHVIGNMHEHPHLLKGEGEHV
ncbi:YopX family protein [Paenibacillus alvei]|uniref:YopX family protein n=1 Tax=Paenibacillus alvei TaxID=44250 RepID=A0ABT4H7X7_PAEAL|nr:YopX family protein [Paenibacillus alvei]MCY9765092.1 YopX family protein [Paenibacillus alvei]MCY9771435.1 YopX family protein [Paenibacillus alvei]